eukprot:GHVN01050747.1.p1 GENE.GHVN01050747.1~~GHVN01050747.1.p1  ORF type:complete len:1293 (-),score=323.35 GHVN01050747.1:349-4227(-)
MATAPTALRPRTAGAPPTVANTSDASVASGGVNVKVIIRCRPLSEKEKKDTASFTVVQPSVYSKEVEVTQTIPGRKVESYSKTFTFDGVCSLQTSQLELFQTYVVPIIDEVLQGFNCTIFAYGQTGTGKTYTMEGDMHEQVSSVEYSIDEEAGIIPRAVQGIFDRLESQGAEYSVRVSYLEIYNEELNDLLNDGEKQLLRIYEDTTGKKGLSVDRLEEISVNNPQDIFNIVNIAVKKRRTAETLLNHNSSRSHCIFSITIHMKETNIDGEDVIKIGKLNLVDLAGSENVQRSGAVKDRAKEAGMINQSLLTLGRVINALVEHSPYVPYRDSKLTRLLQESLGGRTKTCIVATISPSSLCLEETLSTLDYAYRAKNIRNKPEVNQKMTKRVMIKELNQEIEKLKVELSANREKHGVYLPYDRYNDIELKVSTQTTTINELESLLLKKAEELKEVETVFNTTRDKLNSETEAHNNTQQLYRQADREAKEKGSQLEEAKESLSEQTYLTNMIEVSERNVVSHGNATVEAARKQVLSMISLHDKIDRHRDRDAHNVKTLQSHTSRLQDHIGEQHDTLMTASQSLHHTASTSIDVTKVIQDKAVEAHQGVEEKLCKMKEKQSDLENTVASTISCLQSEWASHQAEAHNVLTQCISSSHTEALNRMKEVEKAVGQLSEGVEESEKGEVRFKQQITDVLNETKNCLTNRSSAIIQQENELTEIMNTQLNECQNKINSLEDKLTRAVSEQTELMKQTADTLVSTMKTSIDDMFNKVGLNFQQNTGRIRDEVKQTASQVESLRSILTDQMNVIKNNQQGIIMGVSDETSKVVHLAQTHEETQEKTKKKQIDQLNSLNIQVKEQHLKAEQDSNYVIAKFEKLSEEQRIKVEAHLNSVKDKQTSSLASVNGQLEDATMEIKTASSLWDEVSSKYSTTIELLESTSDNNTQSAAQWLLHLKDDLTQVGCQVKELSPHGTTPRREHLESVEFTSPPKRDKSRAALIEEFRYRKECGESVEGPPLKSQRTGTPPDGSTRTTSACEATDDPVAQSSTEFPASSLVGLDTARGTGTSYSPIGSVSGAENRSPQADSAFTTPRNEQGDDDGGGGPASIDATSLESLSRRPSQDLSTASANSQKSSVGQRRGSGGRLVTRPRSSSNSTTGAITGRCLTRQTSKTGGDNAVTPSSVPSEVMSPDTQGRVDQSRVGVNTRRKPRTNSGAQAAGCMPQGAVSRLINTRKRSKSQDRHIDSVGVHTPACDSLSPRSTTSTSFPSSCSDAGTGTGSAIPRPKTSGIPRLTHDSKH